MARLPAHVRPSAMEAALRPLHSWVWADPHRRARKLLRFGGTLKKHLRRFIR